MLETGRQKKKKRIGRGSYPVCSNNDAQPVITETSPVCTHSVVSDSFDPMNCSPPGFSVHGILQASILKWVAISSSRGIFPTQGSNSGLLHWQVASLPLSRPGSSYRYVYWCFTYSELLHFTFSLETGSTQGADILTQFNSLVTNPL